MENTQTQAQEAQEQESQNTDPDVLRQAAQITEALIFASPEPVSAHTLEKHLPDGVALKEVLAMVAARYGEESGIELRRIGTAWAFRTKEDIASLLMIEKTAMRTLSRAALETLAIIAYHQPVTRAEIEEIRGVSISSGTMDMLLEQNWIKPKGRRPTPGKPLNWGTTEAFLDHFGLDEIGSLPGLEELKQAGLLRGGTAISDKDGLSSVLDTDFPENDNDNDDEDGEGDDDEARFPDFDDDMTDTAHEASRPAEE